MSGVRYIDVAESPKDEEISYKWIVDKRAITDFRLLPGATVVISRIIIHSLDLDKGFAYVGPVRMTITRGKKQKVSYNYDDATGTFDRLLDSNDKPFWDHYSGPFIANLSDVDPSIDDFANQGE